MKKQDIYYDPRYPSSNDAYGYAEGNVIYKVRKMTRNRKNKTGKVKIEIEIERYQYGGTGSYERNQIRIDTQQWVDPKNWNNKTQKLSQKEQDYEVKYNKINKTFASVQAYVASKGQQEIDDAYGEGVDFSKVRALFPNRKEKRKTFYDLFLDFKNNQTASNKVSENTVKRIGTVVNYIKYFDEYIGKKTYIEDINFTWSDSFNVWMVQKKKYKPSTIGRSYEILRNCLRYYWKRKDELQLLMNDKFADSDFSYGGKAANTPHSLSIEQREILFNHRFNKPYLEKARKMMCIQAYTGCRYSDIKLFTPANFKKKGWLVFTPKKTNTAKYTIVVIQPLHPNAEALFKEVNYNTTEAYSTTSQKYNPYIVEVLEALKEKYPKAEFTEDYTSHNMRDTFISICVKSGVNYTSILKWAGLKKYQTLDHYIDLDDDFERQEMMKTKLNTSQESNVSD
ncbi:MAG: phage integrase SAM-like domain-containing protein [Bacteroidales bacterium]|nr:phage integrase SAM-like domain-containing protein [Bacteroidales bacterium]